VGMVCRVGRLVLMGRWGSEWVGRWVARQVGAQGAAVGVPVGLQASVARVMVFCPPTPTPSPCNPTHAGPWSALPLPLCLPAGAGKTTTCTKYAYLWKKKGFKPCMVGGVEIGGAGWLLCGGWGVLACVRRRGTSHAWRVGWPACTASHAAAPFPAASLLSAAAADACWCAKTPSALPPYLQTVACCLRCCPATPLPAGVCGYLSCGCI